MVKEDFSLKKDVLQLQKKVADLDLVATELKEAFENMNQPDTESLTQRVDDLEDLTMVENAALIELKNMLTGSTNPAEQNTVMTELEGKVTSLEQKISQISVPNLDEIRKSVTPSPVAIDTSKFEQSVNEIKTNFENLQVDLNRRINEIEEKVTHTKDKVSYLPDFNSLKTELKNELLSNMPDYSLTHDDIKGTIEKFKSEIEIEKKNVDEMLQALKKQLEKPLSEAAERELEKIRMDWSINAAKVEAVEKFVENFSNEINNIKPLIAKLETFSKFVNVHEEMTDNMRTFKEFKDQIEESVQKNMDLEKRIQREMHKGKGIGDFVGLEENVARLEREIDLIKDGHGRLSSEVTRKGDMDEVVEELGKIVRSTHDDMSILQAHMMTLEQRDNDLTASVASLQENTFKKQSNGDVDELNRRLDVLQAEMERNSSYQPQDNSGELENKMRELERRINSKSANMLDPHISEIINRLVFLESRVVALESMMSDMPKYSPIVVE